MKDIVNFLKDNPQYNRVLCKHFLDFDNFPDDKVLIKKTSDLNISEIISLFDDLTEFNQPKNSVVGIYLMSIDMEIRFRIQILEKEMDSTNPDDFIKNHKSDFSKLLIGKIKVVRKGKQMYRSRKGNHEILFNTNKLFENYHDYPYFDKDISNPPINLTRSERFNREQFSYLYLANDTRTALAEVRPEAEEICSVGKFAASKTLKFLDLRRSKKFEDIVLRTPTKSWKVYYFSQFISDIAKELNLDGIWYRSVQSKGECAVIFNPSLFPFVPYSEKMYKIKRNDIKFIDLTDEKKTTSFLVKGTRKFKDLKEYMYYDSNVLDYIESNDDANEMFDIDLIEESLPK